MGSLREIRDLYYRYWMLSTLPMALLMLVFLKALDAPLSNPLTVVWLQFPIYLIHEFEEHVFPGGFKDFVNTQVARPALQKRFGDRLPTGDFPLDDRAVFWINIVFIWIVFPVAAFLASRRGMLGWGALLPAVGIVNALLHIGMGLAKRRYNPGLAVSVALNIPTGIWAFDSLAGAGVSTATLLMAIGASIVMHAGLIIWMVRHARAGLLVIPVEVPT